MSQLNWTEAQWNWVNSAITEEFTKTSIAGACLPCYGPLGQSSETVSKQTLSLVQSGSGTSTTSTISVGDDDPTKFWTLQVHVELSQQQISDEHLSSAMYAFRRAATLLARTEDYVVFQGSDGSRGSGRRSRRANSRAQGSLFSAVIKAPIPGVDGLFSPVPNRNTIVTPPGVANKGEALVEMVSDAIGTLEASHPGPFACILGQNAFREAHRPNASLALPADRITPMLQGPLLRTGIVRADFGVVVPQAGESIDLVVATPPKVQFLQLNTDAKYLFRVYERFVLRIKEVSAIAILNLK